MATYSILATSTSQQQSEQASSIVCFLLPHKMWAPRSLSIVLQDTGPHQIGARDDEGATGPHGHMRHDSDSDYSPQLSDLSTDGDADIDRYQAQRHDHLGKPRHLRVASTVICLLLRGRAVAHLVCVNMLIVAHRCHARSDDENME